MTGPSGKWTTMKKFLFLLCLLPAVAYSQVTIGYHVIGKALARGNSAQVVIVPNGTITVTGTATGLAATIYYDPLLTILNTSATVTSDNNGNYGYYIPLNYCVNEQLSYPGSTPFTTVNICGNTGNLATPISIANGGTSATTAASALANLGAVPLAGGTMTGLLTVPSFIDSGLGSFPSTSPICPNGTSGAFSVSGCTFSFANLVPGTNILGSMVVGSASSLSTSGSGTITATAMPYSGLTGSIPTWNQNTTGTAANVTGVVAIANGGTGTTTPGLVAGSNVTITGSWPNQTVASAIGFVSPMTTVGDLIDGGTSGTPQRLGIGTTGQVLTVVSGAPAWSGSFTGSSGYQPLSNGLILEWGETTNFDTGPTTVTLPFTFPHGCLMPPQLTDNSDISTTARIWLSGSCTTTNFSARNDGMGQAHYFVIGW